MKNWPHYKFALILATFFACTAQANQANTLEITPITPFPETVAATTKTWASFLVTNISSASVTPINISHFSHKSGLSILDSSTCSHILSPSDTCQIDLLLDAKWPHQNVQETIKILTTPGYDISRYAIEVFITESLPKITLKPARASTFLPKLPAFREPLVATHDNNWLMLSGSFGSFHDFFNEFNTDIYVYDPIENELKSVLIAATDLPAEVQQQLASSVPEFLQDGDIMYIVGGYYYNPDDESYTTLNTVTAVDVPGMMHAVKKGEKHLKKYIAYCSATTTPACPSNPSDPLYPNYFQVTGGHLGKINHALYLAFGQNCKGDYCGDGQVYSNAIHKFIAKPNFHNHTLHLKVLSSVVHDDGDGSGWRRRDYSLAPFMWNGVESLFALAGPFTPEVFAHVWTNGIMFDGQINSNDNFIEQQGNQYAAPHLAMHSRNTSTSYVATFSGLSNLYWNDTNELIYDDTTPYGNILDLISSSYSGDAREYVNLKPIYNANPRDPHIYTGLSAIFIPIEKYYDQRDVLQLDKLPPHSKTMVGYIYGGLISTTNTPFDNLDGVEVTNQVYEVYVETNAAGKVFWQNVTNVFTQN